MRTDITDWQLLEDYVKREDRGAFGEIVRRNVDMVYGAARRMLGVRSMHAEDVTQAVFLLLWQKAGKIPRRGTLAAWLHRTARYCCCDVMKREGRRRRHEREVAMRRSEADVAEMESEAALLAMLDAALGGLGSRDRGVILCRYLQGRNTAQTAAELGISEAATEKRLERGLEKLRRAFALKGIVAPAAGLVGLMVAETAKAAPAGLAAKVLTGAGPGAVSISKGAAAMMWMVKLKVAAAVVALVLAPAAVMLAVRAAYGDAPVPAAAKLPFKLEAATTVITQPLHADGTPDYVKALNEKYSKGVTPENNAYVAWLAVVGTHENIFSVSREKVLAMCGAKDGPGMRKWMRYSDYLKQHGGGDDATQEQAFDDEDFAAKYLWATADYPKLAAYLQDMGKYYDGIEAAFGREKYWAPYVSSDGRLLLNVGVPGIGTMRSQSKYLLIRAMLRAKGGDFAGFLSDVVGAKHMARRVGSGATVIERLVGISIDRAADQAIAAAAGAGIFSGGQCAVIEKTLEGLKPMPEVPEAVDIEERWTLLDDAIVLATGKGALLRKLLDAQAEMFPNVGDQSHFLDGLDTARVDWDAVLKRINTMTDAALAAAKEPTMTQAFAADEALNQQWMTVSERVKPLADLKPTAGETKQAYTGRVGDVILVEFSSAFNTSARLEREDAMVEKMTRAVVAAGRFKGEKGRWPENLQELVPAYLKVVPRDIYCKGGTAAVEYAGGGDKGISIYSVGKNGVDDGGVRDSDAKKDDIAVGAFGE